MLLKNKFIIISIIALILIIPFAAADCNVNQVRRNLRHSLFEYFEDPNTATLGVTSIRDLLEFYLTIPAGQNSVVCNQPGTHSGVVIENLVLQSDSVLASIPTCSDGKEYGECSNNLPLYCNNGNLENNCGVCGCDSGEVCSGNICIVNTTQNTNTTNTTNTTQQNNTNATITCNSDADCNSPVFSNHFCINEDVYQNQTNETCVNPGTQSSACVATTFQNLFADCDGTTTQCVEGNSNCDAIVSNNTNSTGSTCSDGTADLTCSTTHPQYCTNNTLVDNCGTCGCPTGLACQLDGQCTFDSVPRNLTYGTFWEEHPQISGNRVVWRSDEGTGSSFHMYNFSNGQKLGPVYTLQGHWVDYPDFDGDTIVWEDARFGAYKEEIYMYNLETGQETRITSTNSAREQDPRISGSIIVWDTFNFLNVFYHDLSTGQTNQVSPRPELQGSPDIDNGKIVWMDRRSGDWDIYLYDISTGQETQITSNTEDQLYPSIHGDIIAWQDKRNSNDNPDIYMYDLSTGQESAVKISGAWEGRPDVHNNRIVWEGGNSFRMYDVTTGQEAQIPTRAHEPGESFQGNDIVIHNNWVVWRDTSSALLPNTFMDIWYVNVG